MILLKYPYFILSSDILIVPHYHPVHLIYPKVVPNPVNSDFLQIEVLLQSLLQMRAFFGQSNTLTQT